MPVKKAKKAKKVKMTVRIQKELHDYLESQRKGLRDRTGQIEFFIKWHQTNAHKSKI